MSPTPSIWSFVVQASPIVKTVLIILLAASILSWTIILQRSWSLRRIYKASGKFLKLFWSGIDLPKWLQQWQSKPQPEMANAVIIAAGLQELQKLEPLSHLSTQSRLAAVERIMQVASAQIIGRLENTLSTLATIGSTSPYLGLFGTVWGIMTSFRSLGVAGQATLATVAPGIAEALIATAIGLFAAIPAVIAYNRFSARITQLDDQYQQLQQSFISLMYRQLEQQTAQSLQAEPPIASQPAATLDQSAAATAE